MPPRHFGIGNITTNSKARTFKPASSPRSANDNHYGQGRSMHRMQGQMAGGNATGLAFILTIVIVGGIIAFSYFFLR